MGLISQWRLCPTTTTIPTDFQFSFESSIFIFLFEVVVAHCEFVSGAEDCANIVDLHPVYSLLGKSLFVAGMIEQFSVVLLHVLPHLWCPAVLQLWRSCQRNHISVTFCNVDAVWMRDLLVFVSFWTWKPMICCLFNVSRNTMPNVMVQCPHFLL